MDIVGENSEKICLRTGDMFSIDDDFYLIVQLGMDIFGIRLDDGFHTYGKGKFTSCEELYKGLLDLSHDQRVHFFQRRDVQLRIESKSNLGIKSQSQSLLDARQIAQEQMNKS